MEERSFLMRYRQASPQGQKMARQKLWEAASRAEQEAGRVRMEGRKNP